MRRGAADPAGTARLAGAAPGDPAGSVRIRGPRIAAALAVALAAAVYLHGLDSIYAPNIGDETYYLQIARVTAASGHLLPLRSEAGIANTKPPLLFWQGIAATRGGADWELWRLRLPSVLLTLVTAGLAGLLAARIAGRWEPGLLAALVFLGFRSTFQHGRPFLTNPGETLFLFLPLLLLHGRRRPPWRRFLACGLSFGAAALTKSFFLVVPGTAALALVLWRREGLDARAALRAHGPRLAAAAGLGLAIFGLWLLADPRPDLVVDQFLRGENAAKLQPAAFLPGLLSGPYPLWRIWLGDLGNAGLYAPAVLALLADLWRRRRALPAEEAELWLWVLGFLLVYSLPTQRQENYLLPTCAALAVLLALRWEALPAAPLRAVLALLAAAGLAVPALAWAVNQRLGAAVIPALAVLPAAATGLLAAAAAASAPWARRAFPILALCALGSVSAAAAPFSAPFPAAAAEALRGRPVLFPDRFARSEEHDRFLLPGAGVRGYRCPSGPVACPPPPAAEVPAGAAVAISLELGAPVPPGYLPLAEQPRLRQRHTAGQLRELLGGRLELAVERLVLALPGPGPAGPAPRPDPGGGPAGGRSGEAAIR